MTTDPTLRTPALAASEPALISVYTRAEMLADGSLIDVSSAAPPAGLKLPVALSRLAYRTTVQMSFDHPLPIRNKGQELRLHALLLAFSQTATRATERELAGPALPFSALDIQGEQVALYAVVEQQENGRPALTMLMEGED